MMTKNDFKRLVPDVCCQDLIIETDNADTLAAKAQGVADMMGMGLIAYDYTWPTSACASVPTATHGSVTPSTTRIKTTERRTERL